MRGIGRDSNRNYTRFFQREPSGHYSNGRPVPRLGHNVARMGMGTQAYDSDCSDFERDYNSSCNENELPFPRTLPSQAHPPAYPQAPPSVAPPPLQEIRSPEPRFPHPQLQAQAPAPRTLPGPPTHTPVTPYGCFRTSWGDSISNYRNFILFTEGLKYRTMLQWIFPPKDIIDSLAHDKTGVYFSIPPRTIAMDLHGVEIDHKGGGMIRDSQKGTFDTQARSSSSSSSPAYVEGVSLPSDSTEAGQGRSAPKKTKCGGTMTQEMYEIKNSLTQDERKLLEKGRDNHQVQILQVSMESYSNPLPFAVGIQWETNKGAHMTHIGNEAVMFILLPNTTVQMSHPMILNLRNKMDVEDTKLGAMIEEDRHQGTMLMTNNKNCDDRWVYKDTVLYCDIKFHNPNIDFQEDIAKKYSPDIEGTPKRGGVIRVNKRLVEEAERRIKNFSTIKFISYDDFVFTLVPIMSHLALRNQQNKTVSSTLQSMMTGTDMSLLKHVSVGLEFNYL